MGPENQTPNLSADDLKSLNRSLVESEQRLRMALETGKIGRVCVQVTAVNGDVKNLPHSVQRAL